jgi:general secretion pathway protein E/type IV pilus assembly protein PilB
MILDIEKKFDITQFSTYRDIKDQYTDQFIKTSRCVKVYDSNTSIISAIAESSREKEDILRKVHYPKEVRIIIVQDSDFAEFTGNFVEKTVPQTSTSFIENSSYSLEDISSDAPAVNIINAICLEAIRRKASDIHIQGTKQGICIRLRIDGVLHTVRTLNRNIFDTLVSRIKVMSNLNVMENRLCQDGRMSVEAGGQKLDLRVSVVPAVGGQNIVLRIFNTEIKDLTISELGFSKNDLDKMNKSLNIPYGMILVTGPTGSGKTTTLHSMLKEMDREHLKIVTIEDPVEKVVDGIEQIQVNEEIGLTFETILRRVLRQDPDVIMVGEIRDKETAELAIRSALTGHRILSSVHTNDSVSAISRLRNLGLESYLIAGTLNTVIAQRLVRKICNVCKGDGCLQCCNTGFSGRTAVGEVFNVDDKIAEMIEKKASEADIRKYLLKQGFTDLKEEAKRKVSEGITTESEIIREGLV